MNFFKETDFFKEIEEDLDKMNARWTVDKVRCLKYHYTRNQQILELYEIYLGMNPGDDMMIYNKIVELNL